MQKFAEFQIPYNLYTICSQPKEGLLEFSSVWLFCACTTQKKKKKSKNINTYNHFKPKKIIPNVT